MATVRKPYPRATLKRIVKAHTNKSLTRNVDALVRLHSNALIAVLSFQTTSYCDTGIADCFLPRSTLTTSSSSKSEPPPIPPKPSIINSQNRRLMVLTRTMLIIIQTHARCFGQSSFLRREESGSKRYPQSHHGEQSRSHMLILAANNRCHRKHYKSFEVETFVAPATADQVIQVGHDYR